MFDENFNAETCEKQGKQILTELTNCVLRLVKEGYEPTLVSVEVVLAGEVAKENLKTIGMDDIVKQIEGSTEKILKDEIENLSDDKQRKGVMALTMQFLEGLKARGFKAEVVAHVMELTGQASAKYRKENNG